MEPDTPDAEVRAVAQAIRRYLIDHPQAADTAQGIQRWWLLPDFGELPLMTVEAALAQLESEGVVRRIEHAWAPAAWARGAAPGNAAH
jgi:hypothetical protein